MVEYVNVGGIPCNPSVLAAKSLSVSFVDDGLFIGVRVVSAVERDSAGGYVAGQPERTTYGVIQAQPATKAGNLNVAKSQRAKYATIALAADYVLRERGVDMGCSRDEMVDMADGFR